MGELRTFVFTDIRGSVALKGQMTGESVAERDEAFVRQIIIPHRDLIEATLVDHGGRLVSTAGDGHFLVFDDTMLAARWAVGVQQSHQRQRIATPAGQRVEVRMSMHMGTPQVDPSSPDNFIGKTVDYAARLNERASGDQILTSRSVMAILEDAGLQGVHFHYHGEHLLKGVGDVDIYELLYDDSGPREIRHQPKNDAKLRWTVIPTGGFPENEESPVRRVGSGVIERELTRIGNYALEGVIGGGGMGNVYKARHLQFSRLRAIKVIKPELVAGGNLEMIHRFYHEIKAIGALQHRNIVATIDASTPTDPVHYLVMEYVEGVTLGDLVNEHGPLAPADAAELIRQAARGLQFIHKNGMVHRDIKPSNLMLTLAEVEAVADGDGESMPGEEQIHGVVKILDLGLALLTHGNEDRLTRIENRAMGTGTYMSPEQWKSTSVDIRSDIYSLGCTLYHLLSGKPPFADSDLKLEKAHEKEFVPSIKGLPHGLWAVLKRMMAKQADARYASPAEVAEELAPFVAGHNLVGLARRYHNHDRKAAAQLGTVADSASHTDTWWSKISQFRPARRGLIWIVPMVALTTLILWGASLVGEWARRGATEAAARENLPVVAKVAASKTWAEIEHRFGILATAAADSELRKTLAAANTALDDLTLRAELRAWLLDRSDINQEHVKSDSWLINDAAGTLLARTPTPKRNIVGDNYAYRDYFHGQGHDFPKGEHASPIREPHISAVFKSTEDPVFRVAFSVPVWNETTEGAAPQVIGVLSMTLDLGKFTILERELRGSNQVILVDLREDSIEGAHRHRGLILHHPKLASWIESSGGDRLPRVAPVLLESMQRGQGAFVSDYVDPMPANANRHFWGAFEPVPGTFQKRGPSGEQAGWVVLVQGQIPE